jgi:hypothetical protein
MSRLEAMPPILRDLTVEKRRGGIAISLLSSQAKAMSTSSTLVMVENAIHRISGG